MEGHLLAWTILSRRIKTWGVGHSLRGVRSVAGLASVVRNSACEVHCVSYLEQIYLDHSNQVLVLRLCQRVDGRCEPADSVAIVALMVVDDVTMVFDSGTSSVHAKSWGLRHGNTCW